MRKLILLLCILSAYGCAAMTYTAPDGTRVGYVRFLTGSDQISASIGEAAMSVKGQDINVELLKALIGSVVK